VARPCGAQNINFVFVKNDERLTIQNRSMAWLFTFCGYLIEMRVPGSSPPATGSKGSGGRSPAFGDFWHVITKNNAF